MNKGFTLIELLVVVLIIGILSAIALPQYQTAVERSRATEALTQMSAVRTAAERYHSQHEAWPTAFTQLDVDIPIRSSSSGTNVYGGKNFTLSFAASGSNFVITAERAPLSGTFNHTYTLTTTVSENATNGTYSATRSCTPKTGDQDADDYCNAISGGTPSDF